MKIPIENSPDHLIRLGILTSRWATMDTILSQLMGKALNSSTAGEAIYFSSSAQRLRFDQLRAIIDAAFWPGTDVKEMLLDRIDQLEILWKQRNDILHNPIVAHYERGKVGPSYRARIHRPVRKVKETHLELTLDFLDTHIAQLSAIGDELFRFVNYETLKLLEKEKKRRATSP